MHYSGILVLFGKDQYMPGLEQLKAIPELNIQFVYPESRRVIAVLETETLDQQKQGLRSIQALPEVVVAEFAYHRVEDTAAEAVTEVTEQVGQRLETVESRSSHEA